MNEDNRSDFSRELREVFPPDAIEGVCTNCFFGFLVRRCPYCSQNGWCEEKCSRASFAHSMEVCPDCVVENSNGCYSIKQLSSMNDIKQDTILYHIFLKPSRKHLCTIVDGLKKRGHDVSKLMLCLREPIGEILLIEFIKLLI